MAESGTKDLVEGYANEGKPIDRIMAKDKLESMQGMVVKEQSTINKQLQSENANLSNIQTKLNSCNDEFIALQKNVSELQAAQKVTLNTDYKTHIVSLTKETIENFLTKRPKQDDNDDRTEVDVKYLPGEETTGSNLHTGGEGAGCRDAKFTVHLSQRVEQLAKDAAKYWGLDPEMVFFLDRDGRIVPDSMCLSDIILPPLEPQDDVGPAGGAPPGAGVGEITDMSTALAIPTSPGTDIEKKEDDKEKGYIVKGRNYSLTLVRATTVLDKEDLNQPKGEKWQDFTFNPQQLTAELEATRKKRAGGEGDGGGLSIDQIPSLHALILQGQQKKMMKKADTNCRVAEFLVFLVSLMLFMYFVLAPNERLSVQSNMATSNLKNHLLTFNTEERRALNAKTFFEITTSKQFEAWMRGPLLRVAVQGELGTHDNVFLLGCIGYHYKASPRVAPNMEWFGCPYDGPPINWCNDSNNSTTNDTNNSTCVPLPNTTTDDAAGANVSNATIAPTRRRGQSQRRRDYKAPSSYDCSLKNCKSARTVQIYDQAKHDDMQVPPCLGLHTEDPLSVFAMSFTGYPFSYIAGEMSSYSTGSRQFLNFTNADAWNRSTNEFMDHTRDHDEPAHALVFFFYSPSLNSFFIEQLLLEHSLSGTWITSRKKGVLHMHAVDEAKMIVLPIVVILATVCLLMEVRRIFGCPKRWFFEGQRDRISLITGVFVILPIVLIAINALQSWRYTHETDSIFLLSNEANSYHGIEPDSLEQLNMLFRTDQYTQGVELVCLFLFNILFLRYLLMYFPNLYYLTVMVGKLAWPLLYLMLFVGAIQLVFLVVFTSLLSSKFYEFRNTVVSVVSTCRFAMGGFENWYAYYEIYGHSFMAIMAVAFLVLTMIINKMPIAIMLSHKKEKDLFENYSFHPFWTSARGSGKNDRKEFDPAIVGWDFAGKEPKEVKTPPGSWYAIGGW